MIRIWLASAVLGMVMSCAPASAATYTIDVGGPLDELFLGHGWYAVEGPYDQFGPIWRSRCRWASQGATVRVPVFAGVANMFEIRGDFGASEGQVLRCFINGRSAAELEPDASMHYSFRVEPGALQNKEWAELSFETEHGGPRCPGDSRDLRVVVDWIKITADAPARGYLEDLLAERAVDFRHAAVDKAPTLWRMRYDPNSIGDTFAPQRFTDVTYDDTAFQVVPTLHVPRMRRGDAVWYRGWVVIQDGAYEVRKRLKLPGGDLAVEGRRQVWVNGSMVEDSHDRRSSSQSDRQVAGALDLGPNLIVVKLTKGPIPKAKGDCLVEKPQYSGSWSPEGVALELGPVVLTPEMTTHRTLKVWLRSPAGRTVGAVRGEVVDLGDGRRGLDPKVEWKLTEYGEHTLLVESGECSQQFPVHLLGVHFFHWGWYIAGGGTGWNGFQPCSNDYIDQLFTRLDDWDRPHHSICWCGGIFAPGTGFHRTEKVDYAGKFRDAFATGRLEFVGMPFQPRNISCDFGESLLRSIRRSLSIYDSQLGQRPTRFYSHDAVLTPLLPQIMRLCGYDTYAIAENWWGQGRSIPNSRDCYWRNPDGSEIRVLDSWYHGIPPVTAARRAVEQGKPAVMCNEEFACLDSTVFLEQSHLDTLAAEGIFLVPVTMDEYQRITEDFARECVYEGDDALCYKGWTGGGESEVEFEKANRMLETRLVALENVAAFARWLGIEVDQAPIDDMWDTSLRTSECHLHWGNHGPEKGKGLWDLAARADASMREACEQIARRVKRSGEGVTVFNPLGFDRRGLVRVDAPEGAQALALRGRERFPLQPDPDHPGSFIASLPGLPSCGYRHYALAESGAPRESANAEARPDGAVLDNGLVRVAVSAAGEITSVTDARTSRLLSGGANRLFFARARGKGPGSPLSSASVRLNPDHYQTPVAVSDPMLICNGPVLAAVECSLAMRDYPTAVIRVRVSLAAGERQARVRLSYSFRRPTVVCPVGGPGPHEGTYFPGIFVAFSMPRGAKPLTDMAYCTTENALLSTNHETFMREPFRNGTFNALSMAGPNTGEFSVLTRGLPDFFVVESPEAYMGMSLGLGHESCPFNGSYTHEYAVLVPEPGERKRIGIEAYKAAQSFLVDPVAVAHGSGSGELPAEMSFASVNGPSAIIPGIELFGGEMRMRVLNLDTKPVRTTVRTLVPLDGAEVAPQGSLARGTLELAPQAIREIRTQTK